ncbi:hypothetical protein [Streptomyces sp. NPDC056632]|uniref:MmyB family transcriptional regulator n=1 Tax=Streptomyces sp. NPDC056632 TaxID=3345884 RepID=UPI0036930B83
MVATHALARAVLHLCSTPMFESDTADDHGRPNCARYYFLDPGAQHFVADWDQAVTITTALLRAEAGRSQAPSQPGGHPYRPPSTSLRRSCRPREQGIRHRRLTPVTVPGGWPYAEAVARSRPRDAGPTCARGPRREPAARVRCSPTSAVRCSLTSARADAACRTGRARGGLAL